MPAKSGAKQISNSVGAFGYPAEADATLVSDGLATGFETMDRTWADMAVTTGSGNVKLSYFNAPYSFLCTGCRSITSNTAAATVTLIRNGLYIVDFTTGALTLVAATANDPTQYTSIATSYPKLWTTPVQLVAGQRYAVAILFVGTTAPTIGGRQPGGGFAAEMGLAPRLSGQQTGQSDLQATIAPGSIVDVGGYFYFAFS